MGFDNYRLNTPPNIRNVFHVDKFRAISSKNCFHKYRMTITRGFQSSTKKPPNMTVEKILKKRGSRLPISSEVEKYIRFTWEPASAMENIVVLDEYETNLN